MDPWHHVSHHRLQPEYIADLITIQTFQMKMFSRFVQKLKDTRDGDGSLLDHSVLLFGSGMSESDTHDPKDLPLLVVGNGRGRIQGDRHLKNAQLPLANAWLSVANKFGLGLDSFATSTGTIDL
jgi:hypothetical protein